VTNPFKSPKVPKVPEVKAPDTAAADELMDTQGVSQTVVAGFDLLPNVEKLRKALGLR